MIEIKTYSGYKGEERPKAVVIDGEEYLVESVIRKELFEDYETRKRSTVFWCEVNRKLLKITRCAAGGWKVAFPSLAKKPKGKKIWKSVAIRSNEEEC
jgi:hypothetical protein